mgnify:CR=1 FL=1|jgi:Cytochrome c552./Class III cytochrome C family.
MIVAVILGGLAFYFYTQIARSSYLTGIYIEKQQPVQFSHRHHVGDDGIDCRYCHTQVETSASAGIPPTQTCMNCHNQLWADTPYLEPVRASFRENKPIEWERVHDLPEFAYFNHSIHVAKGVGCSTCHGQVDDMAAVFQQNSLQMEWCLSCHREPEKYIRPKSEIYNMKWQDSDLTAEERLKLKEQYKIRSREMLTSCSTCHR